MCKLIELYTIASVLAGYDLQDRIDTQEQICMLKHGVVTVNYSLKKDHAIVVGILEQGQLINPELIFTPTSAENFSYIAETDDVLIAKIPVQTFRTKLAEIPGLYPLLVKQLSYRFIEASDQALTFTLPKPERVRLCLDKLKEAEVTRVSGARLSALTGLSRRYAGKIRSALGYPRICVRTNWS